MPLTESDSAMSILISSESDTQSEGPSLKRKKIFQNKNTKSAKKNTNCIEDKNDNCDAIINRAMSIIEQPNDELDVFGQFIASEMRQLPNTSLRKIVKAEIMKILIHYSVPIEAYSAQNTNQNQMDAGFTSETLFVFNDEIVDKM